jgi:Coenzyme PQQ synthesis protein D (PqqD)
MDMAPLPGFQESRSPDKSSVVREWDLHGYGVLMTAKGVLYALDPVAYRTWQLYQEQPLDQLASLLTTEWDVEVDRARADAEALLNRLCASNTARDG